MFSLAIRTVPRNGADYLSHLRARLLDVWPLPFHISGRTDVSPNENACLALEQALADDPEWIVLLEDDVEILDDFAGSLARWVQDFAQPDIHFYPLGCAYSQVFPKGATAFTYALTGFYGSQGIVFRASKVPSLLEFIRVSWTSHRGFDLATARWHESIEPEQAYTITPVPCFIDHRGAISTLGCKVGRFRGFGGRKFVYKGVTT